MFQHNERSVTNCTKTLPQMSHNWEHNVSSKLKWNKVKFICHSVDNQNLLISSRSVPALIGNIFYVLFTVHLVMNLGKWPTASTILYMYLFQFSTCFEQLRAHHQENKLYQYIWYTSLCVSDRFVCRSFRTAHETVTDTEWHIPDVVLIQFFLLMMSTKLLETCTELK